MLTSAVFLRAASAGIPTAQPLKTGLRRSFTAIAGCSLLLQSKERSSATFANRSRQEKSHAPRVFPSYNVFARPFHASAVCRPSCDWGSPCDCIECRADAEERNPICEICKVNPTVYTSAERGGRDRKGIPGGYMFTSFCKECLAKRQEEHRIREEARKKIAAALQEKGDKMLKHVNSLPPGEQGPIAYAVEKVSSIKGWGGNSAAWRQRAVIDDFKQELQIVKVRNRWMCDKGRVDAMDFNLWHSARYPYRY